MKIIVNVLEKLKIGDFYDVMCGILEIILSIVVVVGGFFGVVFLVLCSIVGVIVLLNKLVKLSVVEKLVEVVYSELNNFFEKL